MTLWATLFGIAIVGIPILVMLISWLMDIWRYRQDRKKEFIISEALETDEGRTALAQAMVEPIRRSLDYQGAARRLFTVDPLPQGAYADSTYGEINSLPSGITTSSYPTPNYPVTVNVTYSSSSAFASAIDKDVMNALKAAVETKTKEETIFEHSQRLLDVDDEI
jgi:hypothetical protein